MKKWLSLFLAAWLTFSSASSSFQTTFLLAPSTEKTFFTLTEAQIKQAHALSQTLGAVRAFLKKEKPSDIVSLIGVDEISPLSYQAKIENREAVDDLIPQLRFYKIFGKDGLRDLQKQINQALRGNKTLPTTIKIKLAPPIGLYKFLALSHELKNEPPLFISAEVSSFHRTCTAHNKRFYTFNADALGKQIEGFRIYEPIKLFSETREEQTFKKKLLKRDEIARSLLSAISKYLTSINELEPLGDHALLHMVFLNAQNFANASGNYTFRDEMIAALKKNEGDSLKDFLIEAGKKIQNYHIVFGLNGKTYLNLPALVQDPFKNDNEIITGITQVEILLKPLLQMAERPENELIQEVLRRLLHPKKPMAGAYEAGLSNSFSSFSKEVFYDDIAFLNLLKILTRTVKFTPVLNAFTDQEDYGLIIQKNILASLQKARPHWFKDAINLFFDDQDFVAFLAATGWIDHQIYWQLLPDMNTPDAVKKTTARVKTLLSRQIVVTSKRPKTKSRLKKLKIFNQIKQKLFFSQKEWDATTVPLLFLSWEDFLTATNAAKTTEEIPNFLSRQLGLEKGRKQINGLFHYAFHIYNAPETAPMLFFHHVTTLDIVNLGNPDQIEDYTNRFVSFFKQLPLPRKEVFLFLRNLFYLYIEENIRNEFYTIFNETLLPKIYEELTTKFHATAESAYSNILKLNVSMVDCTITTLKTMLKQQESLLEIWKKMNRLLSKAPDSFSNLIEKTFPNLHKEINWKNVASAPTPNTNVDEIREKMLALLPTFFNKGLFSEPNGLDNIIRKPISLDLLLHPRLIVENLFPLEKFLSSIEEKDSLLEQSL